MNKIIKRIKKLPEIPEIYKYIFSILFILISVLIVFYQPIFRNFGTIQWDAREVHFYNLAFSSETWHKERILPLWNPYVFNGFPQIADPQVAILYPINFLIAFFFIFSPKILMYQLILHYFLAGAFMFLLAKYLSKNYFIGLFAGIAYMFSGFMVGHASHIGMQNTATWLPLLFLLLLLVFKEKKIFFSVILGLVLAISFLAGHFQTFLYVFFFLVIFSIYEFIRNKKLINFKSAGIVGIIFVVFFLIIFIQFLQTHRLTRESVRGELSLELSQTESLKPSTLFGFLNPNYKHVAFGGNYTGPWDRTQNYLFIGISTLILAIIGSVFSKDKLKFFLIFIFIIALTYSLGKYFFIQPVFYKLIPFFNKIRAPSNMMLLAEFSLIILAILGFKFILKKTNKKMREGVIFISLLILVIIFLEMVPLTWVNKLLYARTDPKSIIAKPYIIQKILDEYQNLDENSCFSTYRLNETGVDRNFLQIFNIYDFSGYNPLMLKRQANYEDIMVKNPNLIDLAGIRYLPCKYIISRAKNLEKINDICINDQYYPRVFFVDNYIFAKNEAEVLNLLTKTDFRQYVILEEEPLTFEKDSIVNKSINVAEIEITEFKPGSWKIKVNNGNKGFLLIRETFYPGWEARVNGINVKIYRGNYIFKAISLPSGDNEIILEFKPQLL